MHILSAKDVSFVYQSKYQKVKALDNVSCIFEEGVFYAITGQSGSGKTTLLSMLSGMGSPTEGKVLFGPDYVDIESIGVERYRRENVSIVYQAFNLFSTLSILENVMYPMLVNGKSIKLAKQKAQELLKAVDLADVSSKKLPSMLSGGQQQRVAIARALSVDTKLVFADEPTGNLDSENGKQVVALLKSLAADQGRCVIVVTHDSEIASKADAVYKMKDGKMSIEREYNG